MRNEGGRPGSGRRGRSRKAPPTADRLPEMIAREAWLAWRAQGGAGAGDPPPIPLDLKLKVVPGGRWRVEAEPSLAEQIRAAVGAAAAGTDAYRPGRVWCYRCESSACPHSRPPDTRSVFAGYTPTGQPEWLELPVLLRALGHRGMELLYEAASGSLAAAAQDAESLRGRQLEVFGRRSRTYNILAQAVFGYLRLEGAGEGPEPVAVTLQAVEARSGAGAPRLRLNVIGELPDGTPALEALRGPFQMRVLDLVGGARRRLEAMRPSRRPGGAGEEASRALAILRDAARSLERSGRQRGRRTVHAEERRADSRPTVSALEDAARAPDERLLLDERRGTVVVLGPRQRVHVFTLAGRHVTSLQLDAEGVRRRRARERWQRIPPQALAAFREALAKGD